MSDIVKGHNNTVNEVVKSDTGDNYVFQRQKRVLKVSLCELLPLAQREIGFKYSLRTLINLRPSWVLLSRDAHYLTCLCDRCVNVQLILRCLTAFVKRIRQYGTPSDIAALVSVDLSSSVSDFISKVLHPKLEHHQWHQPACYSQSCKSSDSSPCGSKVVWKLFHPLLSKFGTTEIQLSQHLVVTYVKVDGSKGS